MSALQTADVRPLQPLGSGFNPFLRASVWESGDEMPVSVLSALARLDLDAWAEASELARLPVDRATERLSSLIGSLPTGAMDRLDSMAISARLIALLPRDAPSPSIDPPFARATMTLAAGLAGMLISTTILLAMMIMAPNDPSPKSAASPQAPSSRVLATPTFSSSLKQ